MNIAQERNYSRTARKWIPLTRHRAGWNSDPNLINIANGYMTGLQGYPGLAIKHINQDGTEVARKVGAAYEPQVAYLENDEIHVKAHNLAEVRTFYVRYNQIKELLFNLGDLTGVKAIGLRNNNIANLGHVDLSNSHDLVNLDLSGNWSVTGVTISPQAKIDFYYMKDTSIGQAGVDYILQMAVDSNVVNGHFEYDGQPSASSQSNYDTLISRGWQLSSAPVQVVAVNHQIAAPISLSIAQQNPTIDAVQSVDASVSAGIQSLSISQMPPTIDATTGSTQNVNVAADNLVFNLSMSLAQVTIANELPPVVTGLDKTASPSTELHLAWDVMPNTNTYSIEVYRYDQANGWVYTLVGASSGITGTTKIFTGLLDTAMYEVRIWGVNQYGQSTTYPQLWTAAGPILAPNIEVTDVGTDYITFDYFGGQGGNTYDLMVVDNQNNHSVLETFTAPNGEDGTYSHTNLPAESHGYYFIARKGSAEHYGEGSGANLGAYYVSPSGNDANDGLTPATALKTISAINEFQNNGLTILFEGGQTFAGKLQLTYAWQTVSSYGTGRAILDGGLGTAIDIGNLHDITIETIEVKGAGYDINTENGIHIWNDLPGDVKLNNITINDVVVHGFFHAGIWIEGKNASSGFDGVNITNSEVYDCSYAGILADGVFDYQKTTYAHWNFNVIGCTTHQIRGNSSITDGHSGNGIILSDIQVGLIENCVAHDCAEFNNWTSGGAVGIWFWDSDQVTIQDCEAYNISGGLTGKDGGGFDLDGGVTNGIIQRCYAHDCDGAGVLVGQFEWARPMDNNIVRYNMLVNTARTNNGQLFIFSGETNMGTTYLLHNTVVADTLTDSWAEVVWAGGNTGTVVLKNNIMMSQFDVLPANWTASDNWKSADGDPLFVDANIRPNGLRIQSTSPCKDAGQVLSTALTGTVDYFGNMNYFGSGVDIGAAEYNSNIVDVNLGVQSIAVNLLAPSVTIGSGGGGGTPEPETTAYMTAIGVPNDSTMTIYGITGAQVWTLFNDCVMIAKNAGVLGNIYSWNPMFGDATTAGKDVFGNENMAFYGSWIFDAMGAKGNGANTYAEGNISPIDIATNRGITPTERSFGVTLGCNSNEPTASGDNIIDYGGKDAGGDVIIFSLKRFSNEIRYSVANNQRTITQTTTTAEGITSGTNFNELHKLLRNGVELTNIQHGTTTATLPDTYIPLGGYKNVTSTILYSPQRFTHKVLHTGDDLTVTTVQDMVDTWEAGLGRKTWI